MPPESSVGYESKTLSYSRLTLLSLSFAILNASDLFILRLAMYVSTI